MKHYETAHFKLLRSVKTTVKTPTNSLFVSFKCSFMPTASMNKFICRKMLLYTACELIIIKRVPT